MSQTLSQRDLRSHNQLTVLRCIRDHGPLSRAQLSDRLDITRTGVGRIAASLIEEEVLTEVHSTPAGAMGRPHVLLDFSPTRWAAVGLDMRVDRTRVAAADLRGRILAEETFDFVVPPSPEAAAQALSCAYERVVSRIGHTVRGVAVAIPGQFSDDRRTVVSSRFLGWQDAPFADLFEARLGRASVAYRQVPECAALANSRDPAVGEVDRLLHLQVGLGTGISLTRGRDLEARLPAGWGSTGHILLGDLTDRCRCGRRGCLEASAGFAAFRRATDDCGVPFGDGPHAQQEYAAAIGRLAVSDTRARRAVERLADVLARALTVLIDLMGPQAVTVGGYPLAIGAPLVASLDRALGEWFRGDSPLRWTSLGDEASSQGAILVAVDQALSGGRVP
ncbi:ROK family protein [Streptomyces sp. NBC_00209]|uniref:ROK family transcriptional regulator n=1 Tax=Streptomyces sp. NBC_00209 TaxID=2975682 RepID=UPI0032447AA2